MFYRDSSSSCIFFFLFVSYPPNSLNGTQPKLAICAEVSAIRKCPKSGGQIGGPRTTFFSTTSQLNGNFNCMTPLLSRTISERFRDEFMIKRYTNRRHFTLFYFNDLYLSREMHDIHNRTSALETTRGLLHCLKIVSKCHELWSTNGIK